MNQEIPCIYRVFKLDVVVRLCITPCEGHCYLHNKKVINLTSFNKEKKINQKENS